MKGIVIRKGEKYFTFLKKIFISINDVQRNYNWLITRHECYPQNKRYEEMLSDKYCWITGDVLTEMVESENFQWIWGIFFAFPKDISEETVLKFKLPQLYEYAEILNNPVIIQHPLAEIEIIAWDSSMTIFISRENNLVNLLKKNNALAEDLEEYNEAVE